jgi:hypothetical protein
MWPWGNIGLSAARGLSGSRRLSPDSYRRCQREFRGPPTLGGKRGLGMLLISENLRSCSSTVGLRCSRLSCSSNQSSSDRSGHVGPIPCSPISPSFSSSCSDSFCELPSVSSVVSRHMKDGMSGIVGAMENVENLEVLDFVDLVHLELAFDFIEPKRFKGSPLDLFFATGSGVYACVSIVAFSSIRPSSCADAWCSRSNRPLSSSGCRRWTLLGVFCTLRREGRRGNLLPL